MASSRDIKYVDVQGVRTRYYEKGVGQTLVMLHGGAIGTGSSLEIFSQNLTPLSESFHVFAVDKIGHGYTDNPSNDSDYTIECMTRHTHEFIRALGLHEIYLIGQSRGAFNGMSICLDDPTLVKGFLLCNSASMAPGVAAVPAYTKKVRAEAPFETGTKEWIRYRTKVMCFSDTCITNDYIDNWHDIFHLPKSKIAREKMQVLGPTQFEPSVDAAKVREIGRIREGALRVPTLVHWGKDDPSAPLEPDGLNVFNLLSENSSDVSLHVANRAGHFGFKEKHVEFNHLAKAFFNSLD
jgi:2-hydroxy-6-oxo-6-(2'-carboxyphenyl)-hexa-2,4-dienoate hydrolase